MAQAWPAVRRPGRSLNGEGNISYQLFKSVDQELAYTMVEVWKDQAAVASHNASEHFTAFTAKAGQFLAAPLDIKAFNGEPLQG